MIHIFTSEQFDGIATSAIIVRYATLNKFSYKISFVDYSQEIEYPKDAHIFFADINPERIDLNKIDAQIYFWAAYYSHKDKELIKQKTKHNLVLYPTSFEHFTKKSAAESTQEKLLPNDRIAKEIAMLSRDIKFWERANYKAQKLNTLLSSGYDKKQLIESLAKGSLWNETFEQKMHEYVEKRDEALPEMMKTIRIKKYLKTHFAFFLASNLLSSADAGHYALEKHKGFDVAVIIFRNGKISFRRRENCYVDLSELAKLFNGGGHFYAAGGDLMKLVTNKNYEETIFKINQILQNFFID